MHPIKLDLTNFEQLDNCISAIYKEHKQIDVLINNAGYGLISAVEDATEEQMKNQFDINVFSIFRICKIVIPLMKHQKSGVIINMSSFLGKIALPLMSFYSASKFAVEGLTDAFRYELKDLNIRVHSVVPGFIKTDFTKTDLVTNQTTFDTNSNYKDAALNFKPQIVDNIANGSDPIIVAKAILEIINNEASKSKINVGQKDNKIIPIKNELSDEDFENFIIEDKTSSWKSLFYNISNTRYKVSQILENKNEHIKRVDISSGIISYDIKLIDNLTKTVDIKNLDKMITIIIVKKGSATIFDKENLNEIVLKEDEIYLFASSKQNSSLTVIKSKQTEIFVLAISDFILKRYLSGHSNEPIDFLYHKTHNSPYINLINTQPIDALTIYLVKRIKDTYNNKTMNSILGEHRIIELMLHRFSLLDIVDKKIQKDELNIAIKAKKHLLNDFVSPPKIEQLAHLCTTNKTKLNQSFKKVYKTTISNYIKKLRLEKANLLLREQYLTIGEISKKVGYQHQGNFSKLFFEAYGVYPKELLKQ